MATEARYGWELPDLGDVADAPGAFLEFANDVSATIADSVRTSYTPTWNSIPAQVFAGNPTNTQPSGLASRTGSYIVKNKVCFFYAQLQFNSSTYGSYGALSVGLPVPASGAHPYQTVICNLHTPQTATIWPGIAFIDSGASVARPHFALNYNRNDMLPWSSVAAIHVNKPVPDVLLNGVSNISDGGALFINGSYFIA